MPETTAPPGARPVAPAVLGGLLVCLSVLGAVLVSAPLNSDSGYNMVVARRMLLGDRLYADIIDFNPPLIFWMMMVPSALQAVVPWSDGVVVGLLVAGALMVSALLAGLVLARTVGLGPPVGVVLGTFFIAATLLLVSQVGQREQLAALLLLPYALLAARAAEGEAPVPRWLAVSCGVWAGIGMAIKPFFLAALVAIELVVLAGAPAFRVLVRPEVLALAMTGLAYLLAAWRLHVEYFTVIIPLAQEWYGAYEVDRVALLGRGSVLLPVVIGVLTLAASLWLPRGYAAACARVFGVATLGWVVSFVLQAKGWSYHLLPANICAAAAIAAVGWALLAHRAPGVIVRAGAIILLAGAPALALAGSDVARRALATGMLQRLERTGWFLDLESEARRRAGSEPIYVMSTSAWPAFPLVNFTRTPWPYPYQLLWPLPALYRTDSGYRLPAHQGPSERRFFEAVVGALVQQPPRLLIIERGASLQAMPGRSFDFVAYFSGSPAFQRLFAEYQQVVTIDKFDVYERR